MPKKKGVGRPKTFSSAEELINLFTEFCEDIRSFDKSIYVPSKTDFCLWLKNERGYECDRRTLYNSLNEYFPDIKKDFDAIRADAIVNGGMRGKYQSTMAIFALKNWCGWSDKSEEKEDEGVTVVLSGDAKELAE